MSGEAEPASTSKRWFFTLDSNSLARLDGQIRALDEELPAVLDLSDEAFLAKVRGKRSLEAIHASVGRLTLVARGNALCRGAHTLITQQQSLSALIVLRALFETLALLHVVRERTERVLLDRYSDPQVFEQFMTQAMTGTRHDLEGPRSINVLTTIASMAKVVPNIKDLYEMLCEYAHPNWAGTTGMFAQYKTGASSDHLEYALKGGKDLTTAATLCLAVGVGHLRESYVELGKIIEQLNAAN